MPDFYWFPWWIVLSTAILVVLFGIIRLLVQTNETCRVLFDALYEWLYDFFCEIIGDDYAHPQLMTTIVTLFFVILSVNVLSLAMDLLQLWDIVQVFYAWDGVWKVGAIAMSTLVVLLVLVMQVIYNGLFRTIHEYIPILWKNYFEVKLESKTFIGYAKFFVLKLFDIIISLFVGMLDIIWLGAKIISLWFRLFGNMLAWTVLVTLIVVWSASLFDSLLWRGVPLVLPLIMIAQGMLSAIIQAFVVALLWTIFIKMTQPAAD